MSGAFGWGGNDQRGSYTGAQDDGFGRARSTYSRSSPGGSTHNPSGGKSYVDPDYKSRVEVDVSPTRDFKSTAANVIIVATDVTGSLRNWRTEIFKFLPLLYKEAQQYLGEDLEVMFIAYGDVQYGDRIEVTTFGRGQVLDTHLTSLYKDADGGGNAAESSEVVAYFLHEKVNTSSAKNVYTFFVTDEKCQAQVAAQDVSNGLGLLLNPELRDTKSLFRRLLARMEVFVVFAETGSYDSTIKKSAWVFADWWRGMIGDHRVCPMPRANLVVETMLAVVAKTTGQLKVYNKNYGSRRAETQYGGVNKSHVDRSIAFVQGPGPSTPNLAAKSRLLTGE